MPKLILLIISAMLLILGCSVSSQTLAVLGSVLYLVVLAIDLVFVVKMSKGYRNNALSTVSSNDLSTLHHKLSRIIEGGIIVAGLIGFAVGSKVKDNGLYSLPGAIIWIGAILFYFTSGVIVRSITSIPLRFGYGGWAVWRKTQRRRQ